MRTEIITVGTEILLGEIVNTNAQYLAEKSAEIGLDLYYQTVVGDNMSRLIEALDISSKRADIIICTGGLGPTDDDLTKQAVADYLGKKLILNERAKQKIEHFFEARNIDMSANNLRQALNIDGADVLDNDHGLAVGTAIDDKDKIYILLPGPPREMKPMFNQYAVPWILDRHPQLKPLVSKMFCFAGIGESAVAEKLDDLIKTQSDPTIATYAKEGEVIVRLASKNENSFEQIERVIKKRLETFIIDDRETTIEQALIEKCIRIGKKIVVAESCTGGWITQLITSIPGASQVLHSGIVTYTNQAKSDMLNVPPDVLFGESAPGAVSKETVCIMAEHALNQSNADYAVATTGVAGPSESEGKPVGLVYIAVASKGGNTEVVEYRTSGTRNMIQRRSAKHALYKLWQII